MSYGDGENISPLGVRQPRGIPLWRPAQHDAATKGRPASFHNVFITTVSSCVVQLCYIYLDKLKPTPKCVCVFYQTSAGSRNIDQQLQSEK